LKPPRPLNEEQLEARYPEIEWREPYTVSHEVTDLVCRFCLGMYWVKSADFAKNGAVVKTMAEFGEHMRKVHGRPAHKVA